jgi:hypothetical protein
MTLLDILPPVSCHPSETCSTNTLDVGGPRWTENESLDTFGLNRTSLVSCLRKWVNTIQEKSAIAYFEVLSHRLPGDSEENHKISNAFNKKHLI